MTVSDRRIHIVGGGIAGLAAAAFAIRDAKIPGANIHIYEEGRDGDAQKGANVMGGALDATEVANRGFVMRGGRMFEEKYLCTYDLLTGIPSLDDPKLDARQDILEFTRDAGWNSTARLLDVNCKIINVRSMGFNWGDRLALLRLLMSSEEKLGAKRIDEALPDHFFDTPFWQMWCTMFSFQPWHSAVEMRRYLLRFVHLFSQIADLSCVHHTRFNQFHSMVLPVLNWLKQQNVVFEKGVSVVDVDFASTPGGFRAERLKTQRRGADGAVQDGEISVDDKDIVLVTNGSMTDAATLGSWYAPAAFTPEKIGGAWKLWKTLAEKRPGFGRPDVFIREHHKTKWLSYTVVTRSPNFAKRLYEMSQQKFGRDGLYSFKRSSWFITVHPHFAPVFPDHDGDKEFIWWGYGLAPDNTGDFVKKKMSDCNGAEMLEETLRHFHFDEAEIKEIMESSTCVPCMMPFITSQFMPRVAGDRPAVRPQGSENFGFIGQYAEVEKDVVFTVEYSVRTAKQALKLLLGSEPDAPRIDVPAMYEGSRNLKELLIAGWISLRPAWWPSFRSLQGA